MIQRTVVKEAVLEGLGLHSGKNAVVRIGPAAEDSGIRFVLEGRDLGVLGKDLFPLEDEEAARCSGIGRDGFRILTVEHLLAAAMGLGIANLTIQVKGPEIPVLDGSSKPFVDALKAAGITDQKKEQRVYRVQEPIFCYESTKAISIYPSERLEISYLLDYGLPYLKDQRAFFELSSGVFESEIAPARTFCTEKEAAELTSMGFGLGATAENNIVVRSDGSHIKELRFENECARHKILDIIGDLSLLGAPVVGRISGLRSGHTLNRQLMKEIRRK